MPLFRIFISTLLCFQLLIPLVASAENISINGHKISNLNIKSTPTRPAIGKDANLDITFKLKSKTGIAKNRIKVLINNGSAAIDPNLEQLATEEDNVEVYNVTVAIDSIQFTKATNLIKVQYLLSSINSSSVQAEMSKNFAARESNNNSGGGNGGGNGGGTGNGDDGFRQTPRLVNISVDVLNGDTMVSTEAKTLELTVDHDQRLLDEVTNDFFNANTNPVLKNLKITQIDPDTKEEIGEVTENFEFALKEESVNVENTVGNGQILRTIYTTEQNFTERQNLKFVVNLTKFYENSEVQLEDDIITIDRDTIKITAQEINGDNLDVNGPINFNLISSSKKQLNYQSDEFDLTGTFTLENGGIASISAVNFYQTGKGSTLVKPKIKGTKKIILKPNLTESNTSFSNSGGTSYLLTMPLQMTVKTTNSNLNKGGFLNSTVTKTLTIPFSIVGKTTDDLDIVLKGKFTGSPDLVFEAASPTEAEETVEE